MTNKAILALATGDVFEGRSCGVSGTRVGELVFNTAISGYQEIITDPSYCKQIVTFTYPHIGNVGTNELDNESDRPFLEAIVIRDFPSHASNWRMQSTLKDFLEKHQLLAIADIDTRHITHILRQKGAQDACLTTELTKEEAIKQAQNFPGLEGMDLASEVSTKDIYQYEHDRGEWGTKQPPLDFHVVAYDFGTKQNILRLLVESGLKVTVVPANTSVEKVLSLKPDGLFLSNGPGDPFALSDIIANIKVLLTKDIPMLGICLGFQLLCLAMGAKTTKMKFGHHGANHPVIDLNTKQVFITSQNHGFMVEESSLPKGVTVTHRSLFDDSLQGIRSGDVFGFQGHPEASPGPHDLIHVFNQFAEAIKNKNKELYCAK